MLLPVTTSLQHHPTSQEDKIMATRRTATKATAAPEPVELEEDEFEETDDAEVEETDEDDDLEELEEPEEEPETKPKRKPPVRKTEPKAKAPKAPAIEFGSAWLAAHVTEQTGETYDGRAVRMLLRKLAKDGKLPRVVGETRDRYQFTGPQDATVLAVVKMVKDGTARRVILAREAIAQRQSTGGVGILKRTDRTNDGGSIPPRLTRALAEHTTYSAGALPSHP
jgi:antitoxin component of RelBE/YafQ-DinJ toxin-antitoxin module